MLIEPAERAEGTEAIEGSEGQGVYAEENVGVGTHVVEITSMNLHAGRDRAGRGYDVAQTLRHLAADVVALQEAWHPHRGEDPLGVAADALGLRLLRHDLLAATTRHDLGIPGSDPHAVGAWGLALLTALPVLENAVLDLGLAPGDMARRAAQVVTVETRDGMLLRVVNTHLTYRIRSTPGQLRRLVSALPPMPHPTVILGDLNTVWPLTLAAVGYRRAVRGRTWPAYWPVAQLDHVLIDRQPLAATGGAVGVAGSDHLPVQAVLRFAHR
ncbi:endonuclease/exonuclease/phosphatase family protein [Streptomyces sp. NPDC051677]|uniref:endonuclease/exonuclease/phosphatase family protein n=1 Tax=Streptomyces sp. NPDC051677 TaxID=3365669 RepID=UPI0037D27519